MTRVISADCHINEPPTVFDRVPTALKDRAPKMLRGDDGGDGWSFDGGAPKRTFGVEALAGRAKGSKVSGLRFDEILPGQLRRRRARRRHGPRRHRRQRRLPGECDLRLHGARP